MHVEEPTEGRPGQPQVNGEASPGTMRVLEHIMEKDREEVDSSKGNMYVSQREHL